MSKRAVIIVSQNTFRDEEFLETRKILDNRRISTSVAAPTKDSAFGQQGTEVKPDMSLSEVNPQNFDAVIFIGGKGSIDFFNSPDIFKIVNGFYSAGKVVSAIDIAPTILANAGALISKTVTAFPTEEAVLKNRGAEYTGMPVEVDGNIVTAKDPSACKEFGEQIAFLLEA